MSDTTLSYGNAVSNPPQPALADVPPCGLHHGDQAEAAIIQHMRESRPLLSWRDSTPTPRPALRNFEIVAGLTRDMWLSVEEQPDGKWWLYVTTTKGEFADPSDDFAGLKRRCIEFAVEQLTQNVAELRRLLDSHS